MKNIKFVFFLITLIILLIIISILSLVKGSVYISIEDIWLALFKNGEEINQTIIWELRLPRLLASLLVGSSLGMSGALLQGMLKNGLASPYLLGISAGSGYIIFFGNKGSKRTISLPFKYKFSRMSNSCFSFFFLNNRLKNFYFVRYIPFIIEI